MASDLYPAIYRGPHQPAVMADGRRIYPGDGADVTAGDLLSSHWEPTDRRGKQIVKAAAAMTPAPEPEPDTPVDEPDTDAGEQPQDDETPVVDDQPVETSQTEGNA